ncbi:hypothetical protein POL68_23775 [Stigmatella sp. ncwal1]|uniref:Pentapeptide repeat-containing protein n=1 Tax=Stigmatella ashevillensis TaxID=2995309 RepID=A0ABT5DGM6_9BACT|nr:hypothetical protein [Stigmatella ashevillena]MDC0711511.1 hypothetical protein [Stigmatella ashevillena]
MWLNNVIFKNQVIENERLEFRDKNALYYLGPNLLLRSCTLVLQVPTRRLLLNGLKLMDCSLEVKRELKDLAWYEAHLKGCRFTGRFLGCDFGNLPEPGLPHREVGGIEDCDFTAAHLHACRFVGCDPHTLRFPRWPHFTILEPFRRRQEFAAIPWPQALHAWFTTAGTDPETTAAITFSAAELAQEAGVREEQIRALLEGHTDVIL